MKAITMHKRALHPQFADAVITSRKYTTIRREPWPVRVPIMLYHWSGAPYRSRHKDVAVISVQGFWTICITRTQDDVMQYACGRESEIPLYQSEGFASQEAMDAWFRKLVKPGETIAQTLMRFTLVEPASTP